MPMGFAGYVKFYRDTPPNQPLLILATSSGLNLILEPIEATDVVWGAGWYNAADATNYADNAIRYEGDIAFHLQGNTSAWNFVRDWAIEQRAYSRSADVSPDGARVYHYWNDDGISVYNKKGLWCTSMGMSTSEGGFVDVSTNAVGLTRTMTDPAGGTDYSNYGYIENRLGVIGADCTQFDTLNPLNPSGNNQDPIPYWQTQARIRRGTWATPFSNDGSDPQTDIEVVEWSIDLSNNHVVLYTCNGDREATAVLQGPINVGGSVTMYHEDGLFDPILGPTGTEGTLTNPYLFAENTWFQVIFNIAGGGTRMIELPAVYVSDDDYGLRAPGEVTNRVFTLRALGGRCQSNAVLPPMLMEQAV